MQTNIRAQRQTKRFGEFTGGASRRHSEMHPRKTFLSECRSTGGRKEVVWLLFVCSLFLIAEDLLPGADADDNLNVKLPGSVLRPPPKSVEYQTIPTMYDSVFRGLGIKKGHHSNPTPSQFPDYPHLGMPYKEAYPVPVPYPISLPSLSPDMGDNGSQPTPSQPAQDPATLPRKKPKPEYVTNEVVVTTEAEFECHAGFIFQQGQCVKFERKPSKLGCKEGWSFTDGVCFGVDVEPTMKMCDEGYEDNDKGECARGLRAPKHILCPEGFQIGKNMCFRPIHTQPDIECPEGYLFVGADCFKQHEVLAQETCMPGYDMDKGLCRRTEYTQGQPACPGDYSFSGGNACLRVITMPPIKTCPETFEVQGHECISRNAVSAQAVCPKGVQFDGSTCTERLEVLPVSECNNESKYSKNNGGIDAMGNCVSEKRCSPEPYCRFGFIDTKSGMCNGKKRNEPPEYRCPTGYVQEDKTSCILITRRPPRLSCPPNYNLGRTGNVCEFFNRSSPSFRCPKKYDFVVGTTECAVVKTAPLRQGCDRGYNFNSAQGLCEKTIEAPVLHQCPPGFVPSDQMKCMKVEVIQPDAQCPPNYQPSEAPSPLQRYGLPKTVITCMGGSREKASYVCQKGYELRETPKQRSCAGVEEIFPRLECPPGFIESHNGKCMKYEKKTARSVCADGYKVVSDQCMKELNESPVVMCPRGYKLYEGTCVNRIISKPKAVCPKDYQFDPLVGQCYNVLIKYDFKNEATEEDLRPPQMEEAILDDTISRPIDPVIAFQPAQIFQPPPQPTTIQIVEQRIPIPAPVVYLPHQAPAQPPMPFPVPVPYPVEVMRDQPHHKKGTEHHKKEGEHHKHESGGSKHGEKKLFKKLF